MGAVHQGFLPHGMRARAVCAAIALLVAAVFAPLPAAAQQQASAITRTEIVDASSIRNGGDMDFGDILPSASGGTVVIPASATPTCAVTGGLIRSGLCRSPPFDGNAIYQAELRVMRPSGGSITLTGPNGATMQVDDFTFFATGATVYLGTNGANSRFRIDETDGTFRFYVGATLHVAATQMPGVYNGSFQVRITYN
jgi:hypothetical protein